jgi:hypothetical protein
VPQGAHGKVRVAIVHDWLVTYAGAERVLEQIVACFPDADLFSLVDFLDDRTFLRGKTATTSFIQNLPFARTRYRGYLPLMPLAIEQLDVSAYDVVISSSHAVAKGVLTGPDQVHISYVHSPIRYAWDLQHQYLQQSQADARPEVHAGAAESCITSATGMSARRIRWIRSSRTPRFIARRIQEGLSA